MLGFAKWGQDEHTWGGHRIEQGDRAANSHSGFSFAGGIKERCQSYRDCGAIATAEESHADEIFREEGNFDKKGGPGITHDRGGDEASCFRSHQIEDV